MGTKRTSDQIIDEFIRAGQAAKQAEFEIAETDAAAALGTDGGTILRIYFARPGTLAIACRSDLDFKVGLAMMASIAADTLEGPVRALAELMVWTLAEGRSLPPGTVPVPGVYTDGDVADSDDGAAS